MKNFVLGLCVFALSNVLLAQSDSTRTQQGEVVSGEVIIEKNKAIVLPKADKYYQKGKLRSFDQDPLSIKITSLEPDLEWPPYKSDVPFVTSKLDPSLSSHPNYLKLGYGNYGSPLAQLGVFQTIGSFDISNKMFFESFNSGPVNGSNSGNSVGQVDLTAKYSTKAIEIIPYIKLDRSSYRFYGNTDRANPGFEFGELSKVRWTNISIGSRIAGKTESITYSIVPDLVTTKQRPENRTALNQEITMSVTGQLEYDIDDRFSTGFHIDSKAGSYDGGLDYNRSLFQAKPWVSWKSDSYSVTAGFSVASGKTAEERISGFYPKVRGECHVDDDWELFAYLDGGVEWISLNEILSENAFMDDSLQLLNAENLLVFGGGLKGNLLPNLSPHFSDIIGPLNHA